MPQLMWDASALAKRYRKEVGSDTVNALITDPLAQMIALLIGYSEVYSILVRHLNRGVILPATFTASEAALQHELFISGRFRLLPITMTDVLESTTYIRKHNINATDALLLSSFLQYAQAIQESCVLVASDTRLLRAATAEGLTVLNPEIITPADAITLINTISPC